VKSAALDISFEKLLKGGGAICVSFLPDAKLIRPQMTVDGLWQAG